MPAISLFSNCGAGDVGYRAAGDEFHFAVMAELELHRMEVCGLNHPGIVAVQGDLVETWPTVVAQWQALHPNEQPDLLCACPPCQGMSTARAGIGKAADLLHGKHDERNLLVEVVAKVIAAVKPRMVVLENVSQFLTRLVPHPETELGISAPRLLQERIGQDYHFFPVLVDIADYGVPQSRKRAFITLVRRDEPWLAPLLAAGRLPFPTPTHVGNRVTFGQCFANLGLDPLDPIENPTSPTDPLHAITRWKPDDRRWKMIKATPPNGGSAWNNTLCLDNHENPDASTKQVYCQHPGCGKPLLRPLVEEKDGTHRLIVGFPSTSYRRMRTDRVASTVTTASGHVGSDVNIHPTQHRVLSPRECAALQTFPVDFQWGPLLERKALGKIREMIGEAVPPMFTGAHGRALVELLRGNVRHEDLMLATDLRARTAMTKFLAEPAPQLALDLNQPTAAADACTA